MATHPDVVKYVEIMKTSMAWTRIDDFKKTTVDTIWRFYIPVKTFVFMLVSIIGLVIFYLADNMNLADLIMLMAVFVMNWLDLVVFLNRDAHVSLVSSLERHITEYCDPWMVELRGRNSLSVWKFNVWFQTWYVRFTIQGMYAFGFVLLDTILHYGFDCLDKPLIFPSCLTPYLGKMPTWNASYYVVAIVGSWALIEIANTLQATISTYSLLTTYMCGELKIFKVVVKSQTFKKEKKISNEHLQNIITWHNQMIRLNDQLKAYLGLLCALISTSLFGVLKAVNAPFQVIIFATAATLYLLPCSVFCQLGQNLEDESDQIALELYKLPWYNSSPSIRKDLLMVIRQAKKSLTIDFHGQFKINLENLAMILSSSYSYFTLFQSMIK